MNEIRDSDDWDRGKRFAAMKYVALALCLALFLAYGLLKG
jgi:hypothetical protein